jgi:hypothetical protein
VNIADLRTLLERSCGATGRPGTIERRASATVKSTAGSGHSTTAPAMKSSASTVKATSSSSKSAGECAGGKKCRSCEHPNRDES